MFRINNRSRLWTCSDCLTVIIYSKFRGVGYHDLYALRDILHLDNIFKNFRKLCLIHYEIDPAHVMTSSVLSWKVSLKICERPLELLTDINMHLLIEKGIRGEVSVISHRYAKENNPYLLNYDPSIRNSYVLYLDVNNLYDWTMSQPLAYGNFEWVPIDDNVINHILNLNKISNEGYILEVKLEYPRELTTYIMIIQLLLKKWKLNLNTFLRFVGMLFKFLLQSYRKIVWGQG